MLRTRIEALLVNDVELTWIEFSERGYIQMIVASAPLHFFAYVLY